MEQRNIRCAGSGQQSVGGGSHSAGGYDEAKTMGMFSLAAASDFAIGASIVASSRSVQMDLVL